MGSVIMWSDSTRNEFLDKLEETAASFTQRGANGGHKYLVISCPFLKTTEQKAAASSFRDIVVAGSELANQSDQLSLKDLVRFEKSFTIIANAFHRKQAPWHKNLPIVYSFYSSAKKQLGEQASNLNSTLNEKQRAKRQRYYETFAEERVVDTPQAALRQLSGLQVQEGDYRVIVQEDGRIGYLVKPLYRTPVEADIKYVDGNLKAIIEDEIRPENREKKFLAECKRVHTHEEAEEVLKDAKVGDWCFMETQPDTSECAPKTKRTLFMRLPGLQNPLHLAEIQLVDSVPFMKQVDLCLNPAQRVRLMKKAGFLHPNASIAYLKELLANGTIDYLLRPFGEYELQLVMHAPGGKKGEILETKIYIDATLLDKIQNFLESTYTAFAISLSVVHEAVPATFDDWQKRYPDAPLGKVLFFANNPERGPRSGVTFGTTLPAWFKPILIHWKIPASENLYRDIGVHLSKLTEQPLAILKEAGLFHEELKVDAQNRPIQLSTLKHGEYLIASHPTDDAVWSMALALDVVENDLPTRYVRITKLAKDKDILEQIQATLTRVSKQVKS